MTLLRWRSGVPDLDLPFLEASPGREARSSRRGETYRCSTCECTWEGDPFCWLCGETGHALNSLIRLQMFRALHPAEDQAVSA